MRGSVLRSNIILIMMPDIQEILSGNRRAIARAISLVENNSGESKTLLNSIFTHTGKAHRIGITGPPGAGKSTIVDNLTKLFREQKRSVGIVAVDPTSPFTGGALLGDRIRFQEFAQSDDLYFRSMATRGSVGGISRRTDEVVDILDSSGKDIILIETVGVGQSELEIAEASDTTIVVLVPESGDDIQAMKAGLMEIADIFVINKSDHEGADLAYASITGSLHLRDNNGWVPPVIKTSAINGEGIKELITAIDEHHDWLENEQTEGRSRALRVRRRVKEIISEDLDQDFWTDRRNKLLDKILSGNQNGTQTPYEIAEELKK